jgi:LPXTG-motif cell wall-anchored protein
VDTAFGAAETTLPKTGGEPLMLTLFGSLTAGSALLLRRKLS